MAIKQFHDHISSHHQQDALRELELLRALSHPNIIQLLAIEQELGQNTRVLVMEYCEVTRSWNIVR